HLAVVIRGPSGEERRNFELSIPPSCHHITIQRNGVGHSTQPGRSVPTAELCRVVQLALCENYDYPRALRLPGPVYRLRGRIRRFLSCCSVTCAAQPITRLQANSGVFRSLLIASRWNSGAA